MPLRNAIDPPPADHAALCVLASGSSGNCSVLVTPTPGGQRVSLIDAGLSPKRTTRLLAERGFELRDIDEIIYTHLDADHAHYGWANADAFKGLFRIHRRHLGRAERMGMLRRRTEPFDDGFGLGHAGSATVTLAGHDSLGVAVFRFELTWSGGAGSLGFATDLGSIDDAFIRTMTGVGTLAIESNYCPALQAASDRPPFLKRRIMGGAGHLSNAQAADAIARIAPAGPIILLHLSRQCNTPERALEPHADRANRITLSNQRVATAWTPIAEPASVPPTKSATTSGTQISLFSGLTNG